MSIPIPHKQALSLHLNWTRCEGNVWCKLNSVNLEHAHFNNKPCGVYIIWHGGNKPRAVYVGQGDIKERIAEHRRKQEIQKYEHLGLYVTWAIVLQEHRNGVEAYLADIWPPKVSDNHPEVPRIEVNSPW